MKFAPLALVPLLLCTACTSVKVNRLTQGRLPKVPANQVRQISLEAAQARPHEKLATIEMRTRSPFAADLHAIARQRTGRLGGDAYAITAGSRHTTVTGSLGSLFLGDSTSASMSVEALRWIDAPAPAPKPGTSAPAPPAPPPKTRAWWRPWSWF